MSGQKFWAHGTTFEFNSHLVGGMMSIQGPEESNDQVEVTDSDSGGDEELIPGLRRGGTVTLECRMIQSDAGQQALKESRRTQEVGEVVITLPPSATDDSDIALISFDAFVTGVTRNMPLVENTAASITFTLKVTGAVQEASV